MRVLLRGGLLEEDPFAVRGVAGEGVPGDVESIEPISLESMAFCVGDYGWPKANLWRMVIIGCQWQMQLGNVKEAGSSGLG